MNRKILFFLLALLPGIAFAQTPPATYDLIAPIGTLSGSTTLQQYLEGAFQTIIGIAGILAVIMLVWCGIKLMGTGSVSGKTEAKQCIWNAIFGILLALGSWILLNTINPKLLKSDAQITIQTPASPTTPLPAGSDPMPIEPGWYYRYLTPAPSSVTKNSARFDTAASCIASKKQLDPTNQGTVQPVSGQDCWEVTTIAPSGSESGARNALCGNSSCVSNSSNNVYINAGPCPSVGSKGCTNVAGLPGDAIAVIISLGGVGKVTVTGGTEYWLHKSHGAGLPIFDIRHTPAIDNAIKSQDPSSKRGSFVDSEWLYNGYWFTNEGDHWHACKVGTNTTYCRPK